VHGNRIAKLAIKSVTAVTISSQISLKAVFIARLAAFL
jgi:hypothetical protein